MSDNRLNSLVESSAESMEQLRRLTAADIASSKNLQSLGAAEGDVIENNQLIRKTSKDPQGKVLTLEDIANSPNLQRIGAEVGDVVADKQLIKATSDPDSLVTQFEYGFKSTGNILTNLGDFLESKLPLGRLVIGGDSLVSINRLPEEVQAMEPEQRLAAIAQARQAALDEEFGDYQPQGTAAEIAGSVGKMLADPTNLLYAGRTVAGAAGIGAGYGFGDSVLQQTVDGEAVDYGEAAKQAGLTGLLAGGITKAVKAIQERPAAMTKKQRMFQQAVDMKIAAGVKQVAALQQTAKEFNMTQADVAKMATQTGKKVKMGTSYLGREADRDFDTRIVHDSAVSKVESSAVKDAIFSINNRLDAIHPELGGMMKKHEAKLHVETQDALNISNNFRQIVSRMPKGVKEEFSRRLYNGQFEAAEVIARRVAPELVDEWPQIKRMLDNNFDRLKAAGHDKLTKVENYFPRVIKDREGLLDALGTKGRSQIEAMLQVAAKKANKSVNDLDELEVSEIYDKYFRGFRAKGTDGFTLASSKDRSLKVIPQNLMQYYHTADKSLELNTRSVINDINRREFFGRNAKTDGNGGLDTVSSIGDLLSSLRSRGINIDDKGMSYAKKLFDARFTGGEATGNNLQKKIRELGFLGTIANPLSALTQVTDLAVSFHKNGIGNSVASFARAVAGKSKIKQVEAGIDAGNKELQEVLEGDSALSYVLEKSFALSGFKLMDRIMKETTLNAAIEKARKMAQTPQGRAKLAKEYAPIFRAETKTLIDDLANGETSMAVKELAFSKVAEVQPISRSELPATYNANPNFRWMYMLKSFMLKQLDIAKRDVIDKIRSGNAKEIAEGFKNGVVLASFYGSLGAGVTGAKDWLKGKEPFEDGIANEALWSVGGVYSVNEYLVKDIKAGNFGDAAASFIVPPLALFESGYKVAAGTATGDEEKVVKGLSRMPVIGPVIGFFMAD